MCIGKPESVGPISAFHNSSRAFSYDVTAAILVYQKQWNGGHIGVPSHSCGSCKRFLSFQ